MLYRIREFIGWSDLTGKAVYIVWPETFSKAEAERFIEASGDSRLSATPYITGL